VIPKIPANILLVKSCTAMSIYWGSYREKHPEAFRESIQAVNDAYTQGKINPHISKVLPLGQINEAYQYILDRKSTGKVVIDCRK
jgi:NADPH2:quinone reductase